MSRNRYLVPPPRRLKVYSRRNSECASAAIESLDWSQWWTDEGHLKVLRHSDGTVHRVYCRHSDTPRIGMRDGVLYWLVDEREDVEVGRHRAQRDVPNAEPTNPTEAA